MKVIIISIIAKLASGRYILTVICGVVFAYATWKRILPSSAVAAIVTSVFGAYFSRSDRADKQEPKGAT
jgi:hypothetical protein